MLAPGGRAGPRPRAGGWDRCRVGERLSAARAGLQELRVLRERQRALVRGALDAQPPPSPGPLPAPEAPARDPRSKEPGLEATLAALKEQLSRLRRQDAGLQAHLDQLGQQISALRLDMRETGSEPRDGDSRPSSGFYELSEGGSRSLSASCTSVSSGSVSSSLSSSLPRNQHPSARPRSADETTVHTAGPPPRRPPATEGGPPALGPGRPRPVSTGDLERAVPTAVGLQDASAKAEPSSPLCCAKDTQTPVLDPKYRSNLVSRSGKEVYMYPSPLHAVALQSPLFAPAEAAPMAGSSPPARPLSPGPLGPTPAGARSAPEAHAAGAYIEKLLQLTRGCRRPCGGAGGQQGSPNCGVAAPQPKRSGQTGGSAGQLEPLVCSLESEGEEGTATRGSRDRACCGPWGLGPLTDTQQPTVLPEESKPCSSCVLGKSSVGSPWPSCGLGPFPCSQGQQLLTAVPCQKVRATSPSRRVSDTSPAPGQVPQAQAVASTACPLRLRAGMSRVKAAKVGRRASDRVLRRGKPQSLSPGRQPGAHAVHLLPTSWDPPRGRPGAGGVWRGPHLGGEARGRSCSESSLCPVPFFVPLVLAGPGPCQASALTVCPFQAARLTLAPTGGTCRKQRKWRSTVEISAEAPLASGHRPWPPRPAARGAGGPPTLCTRARLQPPCLSGRPTSCAEHAALCHSTIAETSEGDDSDHTASCFGDGESSDGDSEGCGRSGGDSVARDWGLAGVGGLVWPRSAQATPRLPLSLAPKLCRIKASRALRKRLRTVQPAAWKVMTMV